MGYINNNEHKVVVEQAKPEDADEIHELLYETWLATYPNKKAGIFVDDIKALFENTTTEKSRQKRIERLANPLSGELQITAKQNGEVIGFCIARIHDNINELQRLYVLPKAQGMGVGSALWEVAVSYFDLGKDIKVEVASYNKPAIEFYERLGFNVTNEPIAGSQFKLKSGAVIPEIVMVRTREWRGGNKNNT